MFNFKEMISRVAHGQSPNSPARNEPDTAEGFLCPLCMNAFGTQDELQSHYSTSHKVSESSSVTSANVEGSNVFHAFHHGVGDRYLQSHHAATEVEEANESFQEINSSDFQLGIEGMAPEEAVKELLKRLNYLMKQKELLAEERNQSNQRADIMHERATTLLARAEKEELEKTALAKRLAIVEAQLAHRENIDDAAVLRQELIQVQRVMDEMTREREMESDQLKRDLMNLQQKYNLLESERKIVATMEKDLKRAEILEETIQQKDMHISQLNYKLAMSEKNVGSLEQELVEDNLKLRSAEEEIEQSKSILEDMQSKEESGRRRIAELEERLMEASLAQEKSNKELKRMEEVLSCQKENARKDSQTILDLKSEISAISNTISNKNKELMALNEKVESLTSQVKEYTIMNEDLRCRNAEQARYLEDKVKLVSTMEDKEKEIQSALEKNVAQMDSLNKNYLELMGLFQAQMKDNNKVDSDSEKKILGQIESAVKLLTKKTSEFDHLAANDKQLLESLQKEGKSSTEEIIRMLQTECKEKSEQLLEAQRRISILSNEMQSKTITEKAKAEELEAIINSLKLNLEQSREDLVYSNKEIQELEEKMVKQTIMMATKEEEMCQLNTKYMKKVSELKKVESLCSYLKKEFVSCKEAISSFSGEWNHYNQMCLEKIKAISVLHEQLEKESKAVPQLQEDLRIAKKAIEDKNDAIEELMRNLQAEQKRSSELEDGNSIKLMEIEELNNHLDIERKKLTQLHSEVENLSRQRSEMKEHITECENKVKSLTTDLLACEKMKADAESEKIKLGDKLLTELHEKELEIDGILAQSEQSLKNQTSEAQKEIEKLTESYQQQIKEHETEIENLKTVVAKEEQHKKEVKKNLEEELLANSNLQQAFSQFRTKHETDVENLNASIKSLTVELGLREESNKEKDVTIEKLQEQNSSLKAEWETERQALLERYIESTKENERLKGATNDLRRRLEDSQAALHEIGRENQTYQMELAKLSGRKWTEDSDVTNCMKCEKEFSIRVRKHHCRNCGQIFCNDCSSKMAAIASNKKPVRVCDACYVELVQN